MINLLSSLRGLLEFGAVYEWFQQLVGSHRVRRYFVKHYLRAEPTDRLIDLGCGPGIMARYFHGVKYFGLDSNERYIRRARNRYGNEFEFAVGDVAGDGLEFSKEFDLAIAFGVLHHLPDVAAIRLAQNAYSALRPGGRLVTLDGCYREGQPVLAKLMNHLDRGRYVRTSREYLTLVSSSFRHVECHDSCGALVIPISLHVMVCTKEADGKTS